MTEAAGSAYAQLLSVGLVWISFHCAGMCGTLLIGFDVAGAQRGLSAPRGALALLRYQLGRALTYAALGAVAGLVGVGLEAVLGPGGSLLALVFGVGIVVAAFWPRRPRRVVTRLERRGQRVGLGERFSLWLPRALHPLAGGSGGSNALLLGAAMGLLPCMITFWALSLAATTGSPLHGAGVMVLLVLMTTPVLLGVTLLPRVWRGRGGHRLRTALMTISGAWLVLVGLAGFEVVPHVHVPVAIFGEHFVVMLW